MFSDVNKVGYFILTSWALLYVNVDGLCSSTSYEKEKKWISKPSVRILSNISVKDFGFLRIVLCSDA